MTQYTDKKGKQVNIGDILKYDEGNDGKYSRALHEVIDSPRGISGIHRFAFPDVPNDRIHHPMLLKCYCGKNSTVLIDAEIIGNVRKTPEILTAEYTAKIF